jgi:hypothetical protein
MLKIPDIGSEMLIFGAEMYLFHHTICVIIVCRYSYSFSIILVFYLLLICNPFIRFSNLRSLVLTLELILYTIIT